MKISKFKKDKYFWLKDSDFYQNIEEGGGDIKIIYCSIKEKDPFLILDVINIWGVNFIPKEFLFIIFNCQHKPEIIYKLKDLYGITNSELYKFFIDFLENKIDNPLNLSAQKGFLDILIYFFEVQTNAILFNIASQYGQLKILKYLHENGCPWTSLTCSLAAGNGHLNCLKYLHENGCPWDLSTCNYASFNGHLNCLKATCVSGA